MGDDFIDVVMNVGILFASVFIGAFLSGTVVWIIWPFAIPAAFPGLVTSGVLASKISWWAAVCLSWIFNLLIRASVTKSHD